MPYILLKISFQGVAAVGDVPKFELTDFITFTCYFPTVGLLDRGTTGHKSTAGTRYQGRPFQKSVKRPTPIV